MISSNTYLYFNGNCEAALNHYARVLNTKIGYLVRTKDTPMAKNMPAELQERVMHATLLIGNEKILASDIPSEHYHEPQGFHLNVNVDEPADADRIYAGLADGGMQTMPIAETFWAKRFGTCVDRFGTPWMVNCAKPMP
jgi:PhnB protein